MLTYDTSFIQMGGEKVCCMEKKEKHFSSPPKTVFELLNLCSVFSLPASTVITTVIDHGDRRGQKILVTSLPILQCVFVPAITASSTNNAGEEGYEVFFISPMLASISSSSPLLLFLTHVYSHFGDAQENNSYQRQKYLPYPVCRGLHGNSTSYCCFDWSVFASISASHPLLVRSVLQPPAPSLHYGNKKEQNLSDSKVYIPLIEKRQISFILKAVYVMLCYVVFLLFTFIHSFTTPIVFKFYG